VVDDDPVVGKSFDRVLSGKGYAVITARDGEEALSKLSSETYDLVFTDIKMPGMSGLKSPNGSRPVNRGCRSSSSPATARMTTKPGPKPRASRTSCTNRCRRK
jgi:DNA-binding LytR/AlgR family response regulator